jgi:hypothetical protein
VIIKNSEVGASGFTAWAFLLEALCGNHIMHGLKELMKVEVVHLGDNARVRAFDRLNQRMLEYNQQSGSIEEGMLKRARTRLLGKDRDEVIDVVFGKRIMGQRAAAAGFDIARRDSDEGRVNFDPRSVRGMVYGATRLSQQATGFMDQRTELDRAGGKLLALVAESYNN